MAVPETWAQSDYTAWVECPCGFGALSWDPDHATAEQEVVSAIDGHRHGACIGATHPRPDIQFRVPKGG